MREIPRAFEAQDDTPESLERQLVEKEEFMKDEGELRMFSWFADGIEALYTGMIEKLFEIHQLNGKTLQMRTSTGEMYLVDPDPFTTAEPTEPTALNTCLDIHNNIQFSPRLCLWDIGQKLETTGELFVRRVCSQAAV